MQIKTAGKHRPGARATPTKKKKMELAETHMLWWNNDCTDKQALQWTPQGYRVQR